MAAFKKSATVPLTENLLDALKREAQNDYLSVAALVRLFILEGLRKRGWIISEATWLDLSVTGRLV